MNLNETKSQPGAPSSSPIPASAHLVSSLSHASAAPIKLVETQNIDLAGAHQGVSINTQQQEPTTSSNIAACRDDEQA